LLSECREGTDRCEDGICRKNCPHFNGCSKDKPLTCPNGFCAKDESECAGESNCPSDRPFRCINNECVTDRELCTTPARLHNTKDIILNISPFITQNLEFIMDLKSNAKFASLTIASGALIPTKFASEKNPTPYNQTDLDNTQIAIRPVADSKIHHLTHKIKDYKQDYTREIFPLYNGRQLKHHLSVRSTVVNITDLSKSKYALDNYKFPFILSLAVDIPKEANREYDFALARADMTYDNEWKIVSEEIIPNVTNDDKLSFALQEDGVYAVVFNPRDPL